MERSFPMIPWRHQHHSSTAVLRSSQSSRDNEFSSTLLKAALRLSCRRLDYSCVAKNCKLLLLEKLGGLASEEECSCPAAMVVGANVSHVAPECS